MLSSQSAVNPEHRARFFSLIGYEPWEVALDDPGRELTDEEYLQAKAAGRPTVGQKSFHDACATHSRASWFAPARTGKSISGAAEMAYRLTIPGRRQWIVGPNYDLGSKEFEYIWTVFKEILPSKGISLPIEAGSVFNHDRGRFALFLGAPFHSWLVVKTAENLDGLLGEKIHDVLLAEAPRMPRVAWSKYVEQRLITYEGNAILPATPDGFNWAHDEFYVPAGGRDDLGYERSGHTHRGDYWTQHTSLRDCPDRYYPRREKERYRAKLAADPENPELLEQADGRFAHRSGLVLYNLKEERNVVPSSFAENWGWTLTSEGAKPPAHWPRLVAMDYADYGWKASGYWAIDPWWRFAVMYGCWKERQREISDQVLAAKKALGPRADDRATTWIVDKSAPQTEYVKAGAPVIPSLSGPGKKAWLISQANDLMLAGRIFVLKEPNEPFLWEAARFVRKPESERPESDERKAGSVVKKDDHLCDQFLYACGYLSSGLSDENAPKKEEPKLPWPPPTPTLRELRKLRNPNLEGLDNLISYLNGGASFE